MTVDAKVYCNCYETGRLREPPPHPEFVFVSEYGGYLDCNHPDIEAVVEFDRWLMSSACEHEFGILLIHYLGNIDGIGRIREELSREAVRFPIILTKIVHNGVHCGGWLTLDEVDLVAEELTHLEGFECVGPDNIWLVERFHDRMLELVQVSRSVNKPICF